MDRHQLQQLIRECLLEVLDELGNCPAQRLVAESVAPICDVVSPITCHQYAGKALTERHLKALWHQGVERVSVPTRLVVTPLAKEWARKHQIHIERS